MAFSSCLDAWLVVCVGMTYTRDTSFLLGNFSISTYFCKSFLSTLRGVGADRTNVAVRLSEFLAGKLVVYFFPLK